MFSFPTTEEVTYPQYQISILPSKDLRTTKPSGMLNITYKIFASIVWELQKRIGPYKCGFHARKINNRSDIQDELFTAMNEFDIPKNSSSYLQKLVIPQKLRKLVYEIQTSNKFYLEKFVVNVKRVRFAC
uniref:Uncharacterized protein n=1 Tax=Megaselia scalaris TaxID=36166 RepID=T1H568_MEGSC